MVLSVCPGSSVRRPCPGSPRALALKASRNERVSRHAPYGWKLMPNGNTYVPEAHEQDAISAMYVLQERGATLRENSAKLATMGFLSRANKPFSPNAVKVILDKRGH